VSVLDGGSRVDHDQLWRICIPHWLGWRLQSGGVTPTTSSWRMSNTSGSADGSPRHLVAAPDLAV